MMKNRINDKRQNQIELFYFEIDLMEEICRLVLLRLAV
jgi:hypothetical protein